MNSKEKARIASKEWYKKNKEKKKEYQELNKDSIKVKKQKYYSKNKDKLKKKKKEYYEANAALIKEKDKKRNRLYYQKNKDSIKKKKKVYRTANADKIRSYFRKKHKEKMLNDPLFKLKKNIRTLIGDAFRKNKILKTKNTVSIIGCSFEEFKQYLESKFYSWMNWSNHGKYNGQLNYGWDIDHIIPISAAKTKEDIIRLSHYSNFQPLCSFTNRVIKKNKKA